jgi:threonine/homoserine/homoserine lactone efflux protein
MSGRCARRFPGCRRVRRWIDRVAGIALAVFGVLDVRRAL